MPGVSAIDEIKERVAIVDVVSPYASLKKAGRSFKGLCPFHSEKTPSFLVFPDKGNYHCFGCGANGDIFTFLMKVQNIDFAEALRILAERAGVTLPERRAGSDVEDQGQARLFDLNAAAAQYFNNLLLRSEIGSPGRDYLARRAIDANSVEVFQLGYAPDSWDALSHFLAERGYSSEEVFAAGLTVERDDGRRYDRFRGRLMFPIRDIRGRVTGFGARALGSEQPKYLNSPQTALFDKGGSLYGIDLAKSAIREADRVVVVEGYVDALMSHQGGTRFAVACLGTAITERQVGILKRLTKHLVLALDPDTAGDEATLRGLDVVKHVFDKTAEPVPNWRGLMQFERKLDADIRIVTLPRGKDPDELIRDDVTQWRSLLDQAPSIVDYYFATVLVKIDLTSPKEKELAIERLLPVIRDLGPGVQQEHYIQRLARELRVGERTLLGRLAQIRERAAGQTVAGKSNHSSGRPKRSLDEYLMALFLRHPQASTLLWQIAPDDLSHGPSRHVLTCMQSLGAEGADEWQHTLEPALADFISSLRSPCDGGPELEAADVEREVADCVAEIRRRNLRTAIEELGYLLAEAEQEGDAEARRQYMVRHEALFAELAKYEHSKSMARLWRW